jgi:hypothetical protein
MMRFLQNLLGARKQTQPASQPLAFGGGNWHAGASLSLVVRGVIAFYSCPWGKKRQLPGFFTTHIPAHGGGRAHGGDKNPSQSMHTHSSSAHRLGLLLINRLKSHAARWWWLSDIRAASCRIFLRPYQISDSALTIISIHQCLSKPFSVSPPNVHLLPPNFRMCH